MAMPRSGMVNMCATNHDIARLEAQLDGLRKQADRLVVQVDKLIADRDWWAGIARDYKKDYNDAIRQGPRGSRWITVNQIARGMAAIPRELDWLSPETIEAVQQCVLEAMGVVDVEGVDEEEVE